MLSAVLQCLHVLLALPLPLVLAVTVERTSPEHYVPLVEQLCQIVSPAPHLQRVFLVLQTITLMVRITVLYVQIQ